ncbi:MAG: permease [Elusimicrobia bacterium]|nr:MAG: permease [Elusimicrobiota bacterium]
MSTPQILLALLLLLTLLLQAALPSLRVLIVVSGAALSCLLITLLGLGTTRQVMAELPWDVLIILVGLGLLSEVFVSSRLFGILAVQASRWSHAQPRRLLAYFAVGMYLVSGLVNNLTALVLVLPVLHILLKLQGFHQRYVAWTLGVLLVACNLCGAATPIGDFPAILLLGSGRMQFAEYLRYAAPPTLVALAGLLGLVLFVVRPHRGVDGDPLSSHLSVVIMGRLSRNVRLDRRRFVPAALLLMVMLLAWTFIPTQTGISAELVCWLGVAAALLLNLKQGERLVRTRVDIEAVLFLLSLFVMVAAVRRSGLFGSLAQGLLGLPLSARGQLLVFLLLSGVLTGIFSAGPSMAGLLEVAHALAQKLPPHVVYVGLALSVCAGSSLLLTAATSGPMAQALTERAALRDSQGRAVHFGFVEFVPVGLLSFALIQGIAVAYGLLFTR